MKYIIALLFLFTSNAYAQGNLQNIDFATSAMITGAGGSVAQLLNSSKMYNTVDAEIMNTSIARWNAKLSGTLTNTHIFVGNGSNVATDVSAAGDLTLANTGVFTFNTVNGNVGSFTNASFTVNAKGLITAASSGTAPVTSISVATANGLAGSSSGGATPILTLSTTITGILKGNGTSISQATANTDYLPATSGSAIQKANGSGGLTAAASGTDYQAPISTSSAPANQFGTGFTAPNTFTYAQPAFTNLSGNLTNAQMPTYTNHVVLLGTGAAGLGATAVGATNTLLHGNTGADPSYSAVVNADITNATIDLTTKVTGVLPAANVGLGRTINSQIGTSYTLVLSDGSAAGANTLITMGNAGATTVTVPTNASVAFPVGTQVDVMQVGAGKVTFSPAGGVTLNSKSANLSISAQYVGVSLIKTATNTWELLGDLIP